MRIQVTFGDAAYLVGPNNAGKSTIISILRAGSQMLRHASRLKPDVVGYARGIQHVGYSFPAHRFGLMENNIRHEFRDQVETSIELSFRSGAKLPMVWPVSSEDDDDAHEAVGGQRYAVAEGPFFYLANSKQMPPRSPVEVRESFPSIGVIPSLSPVEATERALDDKYVREQTGGRLASRHFRNQLLLLKEQPSASHTTQFEEFAAFAAPWLGDLELHNVEKRMGSDGLECDLYYSEAPSQYRKEITWSGDGFQVYLQILFHLFRLEGVETLVLDEPDVYLHPDLQRRVVQLLESTAAQTITATHSAEILAEADPRHVVWVDKTRRHAVKSDPAALGGIGDAIGSFFNLRLAKALRARVVLFVEGNDMKLVRHLAACAGAPLLSGERGVAVIPIGGFARWETTGAFSWLADNFLQGSVKTFVLLDRDYHTDAAIDKVTANLTGAGVAAHVWVRKELESYLLDSAVMARCAGVPIEEMESILDSAVESCKDDVLAQLVFERQREVRPTGQHDTKTFTEVKKEFDAVWKIPERRRALVPAKIVLSKCNTALQAAGHGTVDAVQLAREIRSSELDPEMVAALLKVEGALNRAR